MAVLKTWTSDRNQHVRRLASEGCRPRLPWAMNLPQYIKNPKPVIELPGLLKDDDLERVLPVTHGITWFACLGVPAAHSHVNVSDMTSWVP